MTYRLMVVLMLWSPAWAEAEPLTMFALFGGSSGVLGSNVVVNTGAVGSGQGLTLANNVHTAGLLGGGSFNAGANGVATPTGGIVFNGDVVIPDNAHVFGNIDSGGQVTIGANATVNGSIRSAGTIDIGINARIGGSLDSGAATGVAVTLRENSNVLGAITRKPGTTSNFAVSSTFGSDTQGAPLAPTAFGGVTLPSESSFAEGTASVLQLANASTNLLPGTYGSVNLGVNNILNLSSGAYYFDSWLIGPNGVINFDLTSGDVLLYFTGSVSLGANLAVNLLGGAAGDIYAETLGDWLTGSNANWYGTIFASGATSDISLGVNNYLHGAAYARHALDVDDNTVVTLMARSLGVLAPNQVPEPSTLLLLALALLTLPASRIRSASSEGRVSK